MDPPNPSKRPLDDTDNVVESPKRIKEEIENQSEDLGSNDSSSASESSSESEDESSSGSETSGSSSGAESETSILQSDDETEVTTGGLSRTPDLRVCPLRSLVNYEENSYSPIQPDQEPDSGPVDPVFVDEESSGEAVANAADMDDMETMPPLPPTEVADHENQPPLPAEEPRDQNDLNGPRPPEPLIEDVEVNEILPAPLELNLEQNHTTEDNIMDHEHLNDNANTQSCPFAKVIPPNIDAANNEEDGFDGGSDDDTDDEELMKALEENVEIAKKVGECPVQHTERIKYKLIEKGKNHFDVIPNGWVVVEHISGMPIYLHRQSRSISVTRPYHLGPASARRHPIPINAIPCLSYKKALETEEEAVKEKEKNGSIFPAAKVESAEENLKRASLTADEYRDYCQKLFLFKAHSVKKFKSWADRRTHQRQERDQTIKEYKKSRSKAVGEDSEKSKQSRPALPDGTKIISIPVFELEQDDPNAAGDQNNPLRQKIVKKSKKDWVLNPAGKSTVCILHEYLQHSVKKAPEYKYEEMESSATPYAAVVVINGIEHGRGMGGSKKEAKSEAARKTLELLIPDFKKLLEAKNGYVTKETVDLSFFDDIRVEDIRVPELCNKMSEPSPYAILLSCLQRNYGLGDTNIKVNSKAARNPKFIRFSMTVNEKTVEVTCKSKREGKQMASQKLLQILHPNIKSWSSLLKMYGSRAITAQKNKKEKESEVTGLQTQNGSGHTSPNVAILAKLRTEMANLAERKKSCMGKLTLNTSLMRAVTDQNLTQALAGHAQGSNSANHHSNPASMNNVDHRINL